MSVFDEMKLRTKLLSSLEKVFPDRLPEACPVTGNFTVLQNDCISFQVGLFLQYSSPGVIKVSIDSPIKELIRLRSVNNVVSNFTNFPLIDDDYLMTGPGIAPDLLLPLPENRIQVAPMQWNAVWVDVEVPKEFTPGVYPIILEFHASQEWAGIINEDSSRQQVMVEVLGAELPEQKLICTHWFYTDCIADYYDVEPFSEVHWEYLEKFVQSAVRAGNNMLLTPLFTPPINTEPRYERITTQLVKITEKDEIYSFDFSELHRWVKMARSNGITHFEMNHLFSQWGALYTPKIVVNGEKRFGWHVKADTREYRVFLDQFLPALITELNALGIADKSYFHISDEPQESQEESYAVAVKMVEPYLKDFPVMDALSDYLFYQKGLVRNPIPSTDHIEPFLENKVPGLWTYYCVGQSTGVSNRFLCMPSYRNRIIATQLFKYDIEGFLHWGFNFYNDSLSISAVNPFLITDAGQAFLSGDSYLVYPGKRGEPLESIRYMVFREAMHDLRAFQLLESLVGKETVVALIEEDADEPITFSCYPKSQKYLLELRDKVNRAIVGHLV